MNNYPAIDGTVRLTWNEGENFWNEKPTEEEWKTRESLHEKWRELADARNKLREIEKDYEKEAGKCKLWFMERRGFYGWRWMNELYDNHLSALQEQGGSHIEYENQNLS